MKKVEVVAGVFVKNKKLFMTQRNEGVYKGFWEFPGGKIENNESHRQTLIREIMEELGAEIKVKKFFTTVQYQYPNFFLTMHLYLADFLSEPKLIEHSDFKWVSKEEINPVEWLPADRDILSEIKEIL